MDENRSTISDDRHSGRIAKNSFLLFVRMFVLMVLNLYALRILTDSLGDTDYGLFTAVASAVLTLSCVSTVLSISTQRFFSYAKGAGNQSKINEVFSKSININVVLSLVVILIFETGGLWYVSNQMVIPADRFDACLMVFQFSIFTFVCTLLQIPFMAAVLANEDMGVYTVITTAECLLRLVVVMMISHCATDGLIFYAAGLFVVALLTFLSYIAYTHKKYRQCHYHIFRDRGMYKDLLLFSGWSFYGSIAGIALIQGNVIMLNYWFTALTVAAFGIAININNAFQQLGNSIVLAMRPAMISSFAAKAYDYLNTLFEACNKFLLYIMLLIGIPLIIEMPMVLDVWLPNITPEKILFARLIIVYVIVLSMQNPITIIIQATGNIRKYHLLCDSILLMCFPVSWAAFHYGCPPEYILYSMIGVCLAAHVFRLFCLKENYEEFSVWKYVRSFALPVFLTTVVTFAISYLVSNLLSEGWLRLLITISLSTAMLTLMFAFLLINRYEKKFIVSLISKLLPQKK